MGHGIGFVTATSQVSLYFSTLRPLATGVMLSGSSVCATVFPYLNNYFLEKYGWRDSFWILSAISLNTCMLGALIRPIENVEKDKSTATGNVAAASTKSTYLRIYSFLSIHWVALSLLFTNVLLDLCFFVPNIFLVPLARSHELTPQEGAMLLSFISIGDIVCRPLNGVLLTRFKVLINNLLFYLAVLNILMALNQLFAVLSPTFAFLVLYTVIHGCLYGLISTAAVSAVPSLMGTKNINKYYGIFFAGGSFSLLASAPLAG